MVRILQNISNENFNEYQNSIDRCINSVDSMSYILSTYRLISDNPDQGINLLIGQLSGIKTNIENEKSYKLFCELIGAKYTDKNGEESDLIPFFLLVQSLTKETYPFFPWQNIEDNNFLVYEDEIEKSYYQELDSNKNKQVQNSSCYSFQYEFDKQFISIINEMKKYPRSKEILNLYKTFLLIEDLQKNDEIKSKFNDYKVIDYKSPFLDKGSRPFNEEILNKRKDEYKNKPKELFLKHFLETMKNLQSQGKINMKLEMDDLQWISLQDKLRQFGGKLLQILSEHKFTLRDIELFTESQEEKKNLSFKLFKDFYDLLTNTPGIEISFALEGGVLPTAREISRIRPGGPGILKRINKYGGLTKFKKNFIPYILQEMKPKKVVELEDDNSLKITTELDIDKLIKTKVKSQNN